MPPVEVSSLLEGLSARVEELERRIAALENPQPAQILERKTPAAVATANVNVNITVEEGAPAPLQPSVFSIFGRCVLGMAGAYLLRAAAESGIFPRWVALILALAYAASWLAWAAWPGSQTRLVRYFYASTAALILLPMLWESTVRFRMLEPPVTATVLAAFALLAMILAWRSNVSAVLWVGIPTSVIAALVLMAGTRALVPFVLALLFMTLLCEFAGSRGRWLGLRPVVAVAADLGILVVIIILGDTRAVPTEYHAVAGGVILALALALWGIYLVSLVVGSLILRQKINGFEGTQFFATALLAGWATLRSTQGAGLPALGVSCLVLGAACYFVAFGLLARDRSYPNFRFYAASAVVFVMAGSFLALPTVALVIWLCVAAVTATTLSVRMHSAALDLHGVVYLGGALVASGLAAYAGRALVGSYPGMPGALLLAAPTAALLCTAVVSRYAGEHSGERLLRLLPAVLAVYAVAGLAVAGLVWMTARGNEPTLPLLAVIRTVVTGVAALLLAFVGARRQRIELVWMAYAAAVLGCLKLVVEDLRLGNTRSLAASLLIYGGVLVLIPRLVRAGKRTA